MRLIWPKDEIESLFREALERGEVEVELDSSSDARRFSFACFNWRRAAPPDMNEIQVLRSAGSNRVTLRKQAPTPSIRRVEATGT